VTVSKYHVDYIQRFIYPDPSASALQTIRMAAALSSVTGDSTLFVHDITSNIDQIKKHYGIVASPLQIHSMRSKCWPNLLYHNGISRFITFNSLVAVKLLTWSAWRNKADMRILFVRSRLERLYWGLIIPYLKLLHKRWIFIYEAHDVAGIRPIEAVVGGNPFEVCEKAVRRRRLRALQSMKNFDLILCVTEALANNLSDWSHGKLDPYVVRHASALQRLNSFLEPKFKDKVVLGYVGTIDQIRGVDILIDVMRELPNKFLLRLVGRIEGKQGELLPAWLQNRLNTKEIREKVILVPSVPVHQVEHEIDQCDILLQPASDDVISLLYRAPLKLFDYMVRGKPIIAADVPCHKELLRDGFNARLYRHGDVENLASCILSLVSFPEQAQSIARNAWEQSVDYTYQARAGRIFALVDRVRERRHC
jgi:glycosyltransferase involved in cell wall biosynthesis